MTQRFRPNPADDDRLAANGTLPFFNYVPPKPVPRDFGRIVVGDKVFHRIADTNEFYAALGCQPAAGKSGGLPDELRWERYTRKGAPMSQDCLQVQIAAYLHRHAENFRALYGRAYEKMIRACKFNCVSKADEHCVRCPMHPHSGS